VAREQLGYRGELVGRSGQREQHEGDQAGPVAGRIQAEHPDVAAIWLAQALDALNGRGFTRAVRAKDAEDFAALNGEGNIVDRHRVGVGLMELLYLDYC
jgi:hypothetical protein